MAMSVAAHFLIEQSHIPLLLWRAERSSFCVFLTLLIPHAVTTACVFSRMMMIYCNHVHRCRNWQLCYTSSHLFWIWNSRLCPDYQITWSFPVFLLSIFKCCFLFSFVLFKISLSSLCELCLNDLTQTDSSDLTNEIMNLLTWIFARCYNFLYFFVKNLIQLLTVVGCVCDI